MPDHVCEDTMRESCFNWREHNEIGYLVDKRGDVYKPEDAGVIIPLAEGMPIHIGVPGHYWPMPVANAFRSGLGVLLVIRQWAEETAENRSLAKAWAKLPQWRELLWELGDANYTSSRGNWSYLNGQVVPYDGIPTGNGSMPPDDLVECRLAELGFPWNPGTIKFVLSKFVWDEAGNRKSYPHRELAPWNRYGPIGEAVLDLEKPPAGPKVGLIVTTFCLRSVFTPAAMDDCRRLLASDARRRPLSPEPLVFGETISNLSGRSPLGGSGSGSLWDEVGRAVKRHTDFWMRQDFSAMPVHRSASDRLLSAEDGRCFNGTGPRDRSLNAKLDKGFEKHRDTFEAYYSKHGMKGIRKCCPEYKKLFNEQLKGERKLAPATTEKQTADRMRKFFERKLKK